MNWSRVDRADLTEWLSLLRGAHDENLVQGFNFTAGALSVDDGMKLLERREVWGAWSGKRLTATFTLILVGAEWHLHFLAVKRDFHRQGLGRKAITWAEGLLEARGVAELFLDTPENHPWLVDYYKSLGFTPYGTTRWPGKTYRSVLMKKRVAPEPSVQS